MYNEKTKESMYKYVAKNREKINEYQSNYMCEKYRTDEDFKKSVDEKCKIRLYNKYQTDPEYRERQREKCRERYQKKKQEKMAV